MKVAYNATPLLSPLTGVGYYVRVVAEALKAAPGIEADFLYGVNWSSEVRSSPMPSAAKLLPRIRKWVPGAYQIRRVLQSHQFQKHVKDFKPDVYHEPNFLPLPFDGPTVVTVHDLSWIRYPDSHPPERVKSLNTHFEEGLKRASVVITCSEFVKREVMEVFGTSPKKIVTIPLGADTLFHSRNEPDARATLQKHELQYKRFTVAVGTLEPRKNLFKAIKAFELLPSTLRKEFPLVLIGMKGWLNHELDACLKPLILSGEVRVLGYLSQIELAEIIASARVLVYPSIYEGFGLPPLEAMASGTPVIASNVSSLPEVIGDAGLLVNPGDVEDISRAIENVLSDDDLAESLSNRGLSRSEQFSWERCAFETLRTYARAIAN